MKRLSKIMLCALLAVMIIFTLVACNDNSTGNNPPSNYTRPANPNIDTSFTADSNILIAYFSKTNTTKGVAERIRELTGADIFEIERKEAYPTAYTPTTEEAKEEKEANARPELKTYLSDDVMAQYDTIILGFPIWWHTAPMPVLSFLNYYDLSGKKIITFCTSGSSAISESTADIMSNSTGANVTEGRRFSGGSDSAIESWIDGLNLIDANEPPASTDPVSYTVSFDSNGGSAVENVTVEEGALIPRPQMPERANQDFMGWFTEDGHKWSFRNRANGDLTLYAHWQTHTDAPTASLTFNDAGDTVTGVNGDIPHIVIPAENNGVAVTRIAESAFAYSGHTEDIYTVTIPDSIITIERNAFYNRDELSIVTIGQGSQLQTIGNNAFSGNRALRSIYIPSMVTEIGDSAFNNDGSIDFTVAQGNDIYRSQNGHLIEISTNKLIRGGQNGIIPDGIEVIAQAAFRNAVSVTELTIPATVMEIGNYFISNSSIETLRFDGSEEEWNNVEKGRMWNSGNNDIKLVFANTQPKVLIAYFSWSGTTTRLVNHIKEQIPNATVFEIERVTPYSDDYNTVAYGEAKEEADNNARPPIKNPLTADEMNEFDVIILAYPIWWHTAPMVVGTFLETYDFTGVDIYPITQSASMSVSQFNESFDFVENCAENATVHDGLGTKSTSTIDAYLRENGLID